MLTSLLELSNHARAAAAVGDGPTVAQAVSEVEARLLLPERALDGQLHGRKPVDCILNLALSGCDCSHLFATLCERAESEVRRWGRRRSCHSMTLAQLAERAAAAGCCAPLGSTDVSAEAAAAAALYEALGEILTERGEPVYADTARALTSGTYSLVESHPAARWVFRASSRRKRQAPARMASLAPTGAAPGWQTRLRTARDRSLSTWGAALAAARSCTLALRGKATTCSVAICRLAALATLAASPRDGTCRDDAASCAMTPAAC